MATFAAILSLLGPMHRLTLAALIRQVVATFDLANFFPAIARPRINGLFRSLGYPAENAARLAGPCTTATPASARSRLPRPELFAIPHLPQGAPTSPALANLLAWRLDARLHGLARAAGANFTRYADDRASSGSVEFAKSLPRFGKAVATILGEEGFFLNHSKARIMHRHAAQRVTGLSVNVHCNIARRAYDVPKFILHNCARTGAAAQNRDHRPDFRAYLEGRIAWVEQINLKRAAKLRRLFDRIDWSTGPA
jgi:hypothetical protein